MARKPSYCGICDGTNLPSVCTVCVNLRLNEYNALLKSKKSARDFSYARLKSHLEGKSNSGEQMKWLVLHKEKLAKLKGRLIQLEKHISQGKAKTAKISSDLKARYRVLDLAYSTLEKNRVDKLQKMYPDLIYTQRLALIARNTERLHKQSMITKQICRLFPLRRVIMEPDKKDASSGPYDQICNARLPKGLDPHSVPSEELAASLGYMMQLLNLIVPDLAVPSLHNSGFAASCSRIWQRNSYWDARPSSRSHEYPLFIPRQTFCSTNGEASWSDRSSSNFGVASLESERKPPSLEAARSGSFNYSSASPHSVQSHKDVQMGISLLKKSVACITAYSFNSLSLDVPSDMSTFEAFGKLLSILSSSKEVRSLSLRMASARSNKQVMRQDISVHDANSTIASSDLADSTLMMRTMPGIRRENYLSTSAASFLYAADAGKAESLVEGWDFVEHPKFPPPPSQAEDVEHWTRAMFIDAKKR